MARPKNTDPFHVFNFEVSFNDVNGVDLGLKAGFTTVTLPELTIETAEYKDSHMKFKQKYPGVPSVGDITLTRGVIKAAAGLNPDGFDSGSSLVVTGNPANSAPGYHLYSLVRSTLELDNANEYRFEMIILQHHRDGTKRKYTLHNCFASRIKMSSDLDVNASDIAVEEMDVVFENFDVEDV